MLRASVCRLALVAVAASTLMGCGVGLPSVSSAPSTTASTPATTETAQTAPAVQVTSDASPASTPSAAAPAVEAKATTVAANAVPVRPTPTPIQSLPGLSSAERQRFDDGRDAFAEVEGPPRLGPIFNGRSCAECHSLPTVGGGSAIVVTRFGRFADGAFDPLAALGGSLLQTTAIPGVTPEVVPPEANVRTFRRTTALFGAGLVEAIPDTAIVEYAAWQKRNAPSQAGQLNYVTSAVDGTVHVGRFGWKCQQAGLLEFAGDAYMNEMGVSSAVFPFENRPNQPTVTVPLGQVEDQPEVDGLRDIDRFAVFMRFLAPLPTRVASHAADDLDRDPLLVRGYAAFNKSACAVCHRPSWVAGGGNPAIRGRRVWAFSDFLLHDVGTGDGIVQGTAPANKLRTAPLMGIGAQPQFLHDASAKTLDDAIRRHANEALDARNRYNALSPQERTDLIGFLKSI